MSQPRPLYAMMDNAYPRKSQGYDWAKLFNTIGWDDLVGNNAYYNTCAIRVSIALLSAGYRFPGRMKIKAGPLKGKMIEPGQRALSDILAHKDRLGQPEKFKTQDAAETGIGRRHGIVSFFRIDYANPNSNLGHIDLVGPERGGLACAGMCYFFPAREIWFWPLP
jgi:hypothetical protein